MLDVQTTSLVSNPKPVLRLLYIANLIFCTHSNNLLLSLHRKTNERTTKHKLKVVFYFLIKMFIVPLQIAILNKQLPKKKTYNVHIACLKISFFNLITFAIYYLICDHKFNRFARHGYRSFTYCFHNEIISSTSATFEKCLN